MVKQFCFSEPHTTIHYFMEAQPFLFDFFQRNPHLNIALPDNPLRLQDAIRKSLSGSGFRIMLSGVDVMVDKMDAIFFEIHTKFMKKFKKGAKVQEFLQFWQKTDLNVKILYDSTGQQQKERSKHQTSKKINTEVTREKNSNSQAHPRQQYLEKSLAQRSRINNSVVSQQVSEAIITNFFSAVNKVKNQKALKTVEKDIQKIIQSFVAQLKQEKIPFSAMIYKLERQLPRMKLDEATSSIMKQLIDQYRKNPRKGLELSEVVLKNLLYECSNPKSSQKILLRKEKTVPDITLKQNLAPCYAVKTLKTKKQSQNHALKRRLKGLFQMYSLGNKSRKGLTFDEMAEEVKKMDLNSWMNFNQKFSTISRLGTEEVHYVFKRYCYLGLLDFEKFQKAFKDITSQLFPGNPLQANSYFGINADAEVTSSPKQVRLPTIHKRKKSSELINLTSVSPFKPHQMSLATSKERLVQSKSIVHSKHYGSVRPVDQTIKSVQASQRQIKQGSVFSPIDSLISHLLLKQGTTDSGDHGGRKYRAKN